MVILRHWFWQLPPVQELKGVPWVCPEMFQVWRSDQGEVWPVTIGIKAAQPSQGMLSQERVRTALAAGHRDDVGDRPEARGPAVVHCERPSRLRSHPHIHLPCRAPYYSDVLLAGHIPCEGTHAYDVDRKLYVTV